ncbi:Ger(x)C family spore germination protein [Neobacillus sp. MM2021_6]|uniref:Ger(x)C family spore germination protein n=1 Tax=Bacillaceae TaxID=186817 RepID=UPI00140A2456|nr:MULTISPECIES: Ger(x)C family spore germination protein [Bacillaceae]MBO0960870.1 Ger(x)C family spore germination protein [Neobacillus sp. MM2021_6]NHC21462.1 Ger(x)C family spore germination protein [Bacillus sp. MM2020_4]
MIKRKREYKIWTCFSFILFLIFPLSGCWDSNDPEKMVYTQGIGIDYKNGKYIIHTQLINLSLLAKPGSGGGADKPLNSEIGKSSGSSVEDAIFNLYKTSQRRIHWGHLSYIFLTNHALEQNGLQSIIDIITRYNETHYHIWIYGTKIPISKVMNTIPPINMSTYLSRLSDPNAAFEQYSFIQPMDMRETIISNYVPPNEIVLPFVTYDKNDWHGDGKPRNIAVINGISIVGDNTLKGHIINNDIKGYRWIEKKFKRTGLSVQKKGNENYGLTITKRKVNIKPIIINGNVQFDIKIRTKAVINRLEKNISTSQLSSEAEKIIKKEVLETYRKSLEINSDLYQLSNVLYKNNYVFWKKIQKGGEIPLTKDSIRHVDVKIEVVDGGKKRKIPTLK